MEYNLKQTKRFTPKNNLIGWTIFQTYFSWEGGENTREFSSDIDRARRFQDEFS